MIVVLAGLSGLMANADAATGTISVAAQDLRHGRHPGQNGKLTQEQERLAEAAWAYVEANMHPETCLVNSVDQYPSTTMWDLGSTISAYVAAFELGMIDAPDFDRRMTCLVSSLNRLPLFRGELPNKAYHTHTLEQVNYKNDPGEIGASAIDLGRLLLWLEIVKRRYPGYAEEIDRAVLRWNFCNVTDRAGSMYGAVAGEGDGVRYLQEGRLGYEEYAAAGFALWGFNTEAAAALEPYETMDIYGVPIAYDGRDPRKFGAHTYVVTESYLLSGIEMNWDVPGGTDPGNDLWHSDRPNAKLARLVYKVQKRRWKRTGILTARTEHQVVGEPFFVYDTVYSDGEAWNTLGVNGKQYPELASVSSKAVVGMSVLFDTRYTDRLFASVQRLVDPMKGVEEGYIESTGKPIEARTINTNGIALAALLYKLQGRLLPPKGSDTLWDTVPNEEYPGYWQCLSGSAADRQKAEPQAGGSYQIGE